MSKKEEREEKKGRRKEEREGRRGRGGGKERGRERDENENVSKCSLSGLPVFLLSLTSRYLFPFSFSKKVVTHLVGWKDGPMVKITCCFLRGLEFGS